ncbi:MAG: ATP-binding cassette domain-containing protein [Bacteroidota bacterium]|nr:ATP-binding cassette domain-containing protein [Bacteroidota bacterium]
MITIKNLCLSYGNIEVIKDLNMQILTGTIHGLVGLNGSGKTTLLSSMYGLKAANAGTIYYCGATLKRSEIGYLETNNFFYSRITGREYLHLFRSINNNLQGWNEIFELPLDNFIESYSTGMKKKLALLGIILMNKPILILDEPFNGIDLETTQKIKLIILALKKKSKTIIITSHILESLTSICDSISYLKEKRVKNSFDKENFKEIENEIFGSFNEENNNKINGLMENT